MEELFVWFNRTKLPAGYPMKDDTVFKSSFDPKKPFYLPAQNWQLYNHYKMQPPSVAPYTFPEKMYLVLKKSKPVAFDFYYHGYFVHLVSERFFQYIQAKGLGKEYYEVAELMIIDKGGNPLTAEKYYALRYLKFDDMLFEFPAEGRKRAAGLRDRFLYCNLHLKNRDVDKQIFVLSEFCYMDTLIFTATVKDDLLGNFISPEIFNVQDFPYVFNNQYNWELLPEHNQYRL